MLDNIKLGSIELTGDAFLVLVSGLILFFILLMNYGNKYDFYLLLLGYLIATYRINCMIVGNCILFARFVAIVTFIISTLVLMNLDAFVKDLLNRRSNSKSLIYAP